jgi:hypothetical protein
MGLDMNLYGRKWYWSTWGDEPERKEDGFKVRNVELDLGYWRKHPDLHGFIVKEFAGGKDDCQEIELSLDKLHAIVRAVKDKRLPKTSGFFFGESDNDAKQIASDVAVLEKAIDWLEQSDVAPVDIIKPKPIGGGLMMAEVKRDETMADSKQQRVTRDVVYRASW